MNTRIVICVVIITTAMLGGAWAITGTWMSFALVVSMTGMSLWTRQKTEQ